MGFACCVPGCYKKAAIRFPQNPTLRKEWVSNINRLEAGSKYKLFSPDDKKHRICSDHFEGGLKTDRNNVPTLFPGRVVTVRKRQTKTSTSANVSHPRPRKLSSETVKRQRTIGVKNQRGGLLMLLPGINGADRKSTRLNSSHLVISYAVFCLKKKKLYSHIP